MSAPRTDSYLRRPARTSGEAYGNLGQLSQSRRGTASVPSSSTAEMLTSYPGTVGGAKTSAADRGEPDAGFSHRKKPRKLASADFSAGTSRVSSQSRAVDLQWEEPNVLTRQLPTSSVGVASTSTPINLDAALAQAKVQAEKHLQSAQALARITLQRGRHSAFEQVSASDARLGAARVGSEDRGRDFRTPTWGQFLSSGKVATAGLHVPAPSSDRVLSYTSTQPRLAAPYPVEGTRHAATSHQLHSLQQISSLAAQRSAIEHIVHKGRQQLRMERRAWHADELQLSDRVRQMSAQVDDLHGALRAIQRENRALSEAIADERHEKEHALSILTEKARHMAEFQM